MPVILIACLDMTYGYEWYVDPITNTKICMLDRDWINMSSYFTNYSTLNNEHKWQNMCTYPIKELIYVQTDNHNSISGGSIFHMSFVDASCRFANATQNLFCCANLMARSWRIWKMNQITPTYTSNLYLLASIWCSRKGDRVRRIA